MMQIQIDNFFVDKAEYDGTAGARINIDQKDGAREVSYTNELIFYGAAKAYILDKLVFGQNPQTDFITISIYDDNACCTEDDGSPLLLFVGKTSRADIKWAEEFGKSDCGVVCTIIDASQLSDKILCVKNTIIHSVRDGDGRRVTDGENEFRRAPFFGYFEETRPKSYTYITAYLLLFILTLYFPLTLVFSILTLGFVDLSLIYGFLLDIAFKKRYHKAPFIHSYLTNVCRLCGLTLRSSLFEPSRPLHNLTRLDAPYSEGGTFIADARRIWSDFNRPNITLPQLLDSFRDLNIAYDVTDTELIVERKDLLRSGFWIDFIARGEADILEKAYETSDEAQPAGELFEYSEDQSDKVGNEVTRLWSGAVVDYNNPRVPVLRGIKQTLIPYGTTRFVSDGDYTEQESVLNFLRNSGYFNFVTFGQAQIDPNGIISQTGVFSQPKLLMWDGVSNLNDAKVESINGIINGRLWLRNDMFDKYGFNGLYFTLLRINDPRLNLQKNLPYTLRFTYRCEDIKSLDNARRVQFDFMGRGAVIGTIETIEIDIENTEITITGTI